MGRERKSGRVRGGKVKGNNKEDRKRVKDDKNMRMTEQVRQSEKIEAEQKEWL